MLVGGLLSAGAVAVSLAGYGGAGWLGVLLYRPALVTVPAAFLTMIVVSRLTAGSGRPTPTRCCCGCTPPSASA